MICINRKCADCPHFKKTTNLCTFQEKNLKVYPHQSVCRFITNKADFQEAIGIHGIVSFESNFLGGDLRPFIGRVETFIEENLTVVVSGKSLTGTSAATFQFDPNVILPNGKLPFSLLMNGYSYDGLRKACLPNKFQDYFGKEHPIEIVDLATCDGIVLYHQEIIEDYSMDVEFGGHCYVDESKYALYVPDQDEFIPIKTIEDWKGVLKYIPKHVEDDFDTEFNPFNYINAHILELTKYEDLDGPNQRSRDIQNNEFPNMESKYFAAMSIGLLQNMLNNEESSYADNMSDWKTYHENDIAEKHRPGMRSRIEHLKECIKLKGETV